MFRRATKPSSPTGVASCCSTITVGAGPSGTRQQPSRTSGRPTRSRRSAIPRAWWSGRTSRPMTSRTKTWQRTTGRYWRVSSAGTVLRPTRPSYDTFHTRSCPAHGCLPASAARHRTHHPVASRTTADRAIPAGRPSPRRRATVRLAAGRTWRARSRCHEPCPRATSVRGAAHLHELPRHGSLVLACSRLCRTLDGLSSEHVAVGVVSLGTIRSYLGSSPDLQLTRVRMSLG